MATQFKSAVRRDFWLGVGFGTVIDFAIVFLLLLFFDLTMGERLAISAAIIVGWFVFSFLYGLLGVAKALLVFSLYERKGRVTALVDEFTALRMPRPGLIYVDADEYLNEVAKADQAPDDARLFAGVMIGSLETLRATNQMHLSMTLAITLEDAIKEYRRRVGSVRPDGSDALADEG